MRLTEAHLTQYENEGFLLFPELFSPAEVSVLKANVHRAVETTGAGLIKDKRGETKAMSLWEGEGDSPFDLLPRLPRLLGPTRQLLRDEVYHYHSKFMYKEPRTGGNILWHQDYGYWKGAGFPSPNMLSVFIFLDEARLDNGCLKVMVGAHKNGRQEHDHFDSNMDARQLGIVPAAFEAMAKHHEIRPVTGKAGAAIFFDSNLPHGSDDNLSDDPRLVVIVALNAMGNLSGKEKSPPLALESVSDDSLLRWTPKTEIS